MRIAHFLCEPKCSAGSDLNDKNCSYFLAETSLQDFWKERKHPFRGSRTGRKAQREERPERRGAHAAQAASFLPPPLYPSPRHLLATSRINGQRQEEAKRHRLASGPVLRGIEDPAAIAELLRHQVPAIPRGELLCSKKPGPSRSSAARPAASADSLAAQWTRGALHYEGWEWPITGRTTVFTRMLMMWVPGELGAMRVG